MCVTDNKELVKKLMASANEITMGIVAPRTLTFVKTIEVCQRQNVYLNVSSLH